MSQRWGMGERPYLIVTVRRALYASSSFLPCFLLHSSFIYPSSFLTSYSLRLTPSSFLLPSESFLLPPSFSLLHHSSFLIPPSSFIVPSTGPYDDKLKQGGEPCRQNLECETGVCKGNWHGLRTGVCTGTGHEGGIESMPGSLGAFSPCRHNKDCKSHLCENNWGGVRIGTCAETPSGHSHGERCKHNAECTSGVCAGNWGGMREGRCATEPGRASAALAGAGAAGDRRYDKRFIIYSV